MIDRLLDALRYKSEGTDLDFKQAQYRFIGGNEETKSELLKDIVAIANSWRSGPGYILLGFRDSRPHPAEVIGIKSSIDDAQIQQFIKSKVRPTLQFSYEEHLYAGKTIGVIAIPQQKRPFYLDNDYGRLKKNVVYVRRGSSTDEATPLESASMAAEDQPEAASIDLRVLAPDGADAPASYERLLLINDGASFPDFGFRVNDPLGLGSMSSHHIFANGDYWRELFRFHQTQKWAILLKFAIRNQSRRQLTNTKLEIRVSPKPACDFMLMPRHKLPHKPKQQQDLSRALRNMALSSAISERRVEIEENELGKVCNIRIGNLLPGEEARSPESLAIMLNKSSSLTLDLRILAAELARPQEYSREFSVTLERRKLDFPLFRAEFELA